MSRGERTPIEEIVEMKVSPFAGAPAEPLMLVDVPRLTTAHYAESPDPSVSRHTARAELLEVDFGAGDVKELKQ